MNASIILAMALISQTQIYVCQYPSTIPVVVPSTIPVVPSTIVYSSPVIREKIYFYDVERTRFYADAKLPSGAYLTVPVINGYAPKVTISQHQDGSTLREYFYDERTVYKGGVINYQNQDMRSLPPAPKRIVMPSPHEPDCKENIERLEKMIVELQKGKINASMPVPAPAPVRMPDQVPESLYMKRPSEFDR